MEQIKLYKEEWWPTPIWYTDISHNDINPEIIVQECQAEKSRGYGRDFTEFGQSWGSHNLVDPIKAGVYPELKKLSDFVENTATYISEDYGFIRPILKIEEAWCNFQYPNGMQTVHTHIRPLVALYYAQAAEGSGKIWFRPPEPMSYSNKMFTKSDNRYNFEKVDYSPIVGRIFFFPGWLSHHVVLNQSTQDRISVSFDLI